MDQTQALYDDAQANEILRTAVRLAAPGEITFEEMVAAAAELGISRDELIDAEAQYKKNSSEEGQKAEFRRMQRHEFHLSIFHAALLAGIALLIILIDFRDVARFTVPVVLGLAGFFIARKYQNLFSIESESNKKAFDDWTKMKDVWLRPEKAKEIVDSIMHTQIRNRRAGYDSLESRVIRSLKDGLGYDKKRAVCVYEAYLREHPELEVQLER